MRVISNAPVVFGAALLILAAGIWWAMDWRYSGVVTNRDAEISSLRTQRDEYKEKLSGASPDQAAQRIAALEAAIKEFEPKPQRHLTEEQKKKLTEELTPLAKDIKQIFVFAELGRESTRYATDFMQVFKNAGIEPIGPISTIPNYASETGILVGLTDPKKPSDLATKYMAALRAADFNIGITTWSVPLGTLDFDLYICGY